MNIKKVGNDFIIIYMCKQFFLFSFITYFLETSLPSFLIQKPYFSWETSGPPKLSYSLIQGTTNRLRSN